MGRYRAPLPKSTAIITQEGEQKLREELNYLWKEKRPAVTKAVSEAAALGDRSENAEYIYGKKQLREIDRRVRYLTKRLEELKVVTTYPDDQNRIYFGAWVTIEDEKGQHNRYRIVGPDEFDLKKNMISIDSPVAKALLGKGLEDEIEIVIEQSAKWYSVIKIEYL